MSSPLFSKGVLIRRKWLKLATYVKRLSTWATPTLLLLDCLMEKSPVDKARAMPFSMVVDLIILSMLVGLIIFSTSSVDRHDP
ncbi:hypothetical protein EBR57_10695 [bacterium]|nr:hypothetical protein [bacterium]